ncbi:glutathione s-transferase [Diplodia corticola]|uniref:Glutathione s-transferase n=1 Tax=Diplodia corticola TaxID=236234 RepID=A0A1J9R6R0_9PEZI|nr:glutathione s-transferase [Diplodia corticola]OJD36217.1 glutathione s-transferase [Diplodia corticola]
MSAPEAKRQRTQPTYELLYHPGIPGRGEYIRLVLEAAGAPYSDVANEKGSAGYATVQALCCSATSTGDDDGNPPVFAPPALRVAGAGKGGRALLVAQTPNILAYLAPRVGLAPADEADALHANQVVLTALDLSNETHDSHHPIAVSLYYEDQKEEAARRAVDFRENRIPKFFGYFERTLKGNEGLGKGKYLVGDKLSHADTTVWQVIDGLLFAFPKELQARKEEFPLIFEKFYPGIKEEKGLKEYLASDRRLKYSQGLFRHYPELDRE